MKNLKEFKLIMNNLLDEKNVYLLNVKKDNYIIVPCTNLLLYKKVDNAKFESKISFFKINCFSFKELKVKYFKDNIIIDNVTDDEKCKIEKQKKFISISSEPVKDSELFNKYLKYNIDNTSNIVLQVNKKTLEITGLSPEDNFKIVKDYEKLKEDNYFFQLNHIKVIIKNIGGIKELGIKKEGRQVALHLKGTIGESILSNYILS